MAIDELDRRRMAQALDLAQEAIGLSDPNPRVGCLLADVSGDLIASGHTQQVGGPHAEAVALEQAVRAGRSVAGGTAWVTLEPCAHQGRTPPCADALVRAGLGRVVVAVSDPFPKVAGAGLARLRDAGVQVDVFDPQDALALRARDLNIGFFSRFERQRPWVRLKVAMSLDGRTALANGVSQWITGEAARKDTHAWRRRASAVLTGIGTVLADRPRMDVRWVETARQPLRVILDSSLRTPTNTPMLAPPGRCLIVTTAAAVTDHATPRYPGVELLVCREHDGRVDLHDLLSRLHALDVNELHVEAGATLNGAFLAQRLVDEMIVYMAPRVLGEGPAIAAFGPSARIEDTVAMRLMEIKPIGPDLCLQFRQASGA